MVHESTLEPIGGLSAQRLMAIAAHLNLSCKGPNLQELLGKPYVGWHCSGSIAGDDPTSLVTFDFMGIDEDRILSVSGQVHSSPQTSDYPRACRKIAGYVLAALDPSISDPAGAWLDQVLTDKSTDRLEVGGVVLDVILQTDRSLSFDIHTAGF